MKARILAICTTVLLLAFSSPLRAVPITFAFSGTVTDVVDYGSHLDGSIVRGGPFSGYYTFDSEMVDSSPDTDRGYYSASGVPSSLFFLQMGDYALSVPLDHIAVENEDKDKYAVDSASFVFSGLPTTLGFWIVDPSASILTDDRLPLTPPTLSSLAWSYRQFGFGGDNGVSYFGVNGTVESLLVVPEPSGIFLVLSGFIASSTVLRRSCRLP